MAGVVFCAGEVGCFVAVWSPCFVWLFEVCRSLVCWDDCP